MPPSSRLLPKMSAVPRAMRRPPRTLKGRSAAVTRSETTATGEAVTVAAYYPPAITASMAARCAADGTEKDDGAYLKVKCAAQCADVQGHNAVVLRARFRPVGGAWNGYTALLPGAEQLLGGGL